MNTKGWVERLACFFRPLGLLKYALVVVLLLLFLPFTAYPRVPLNNLIGGLFQELGFWDAFWLAFSAASVAWSLMWVTALLVEDFDGQLDQSGNPLIPGRLQDWLNFGVGHWQFWTATGLLLPSFFVVVHQAQWSGATFLGFILGVAAAFVLLVAACTPARVVDPTMKPLPFAFLEVIWRWLCDAPTDDFRQWICRWMRWMYGLFLWPTRFRIKGRRIFRYAYQLGREAADPRIARCWPEAHFLAATNLILILVAYLVINLRFYPGRSYAPTAGAYVYAIFTLGVWSFGFLALHLRRLSLSPLWILVLFALLSYWKRDHTFDVSVLDAKTDGHPAKTLTPIQAATTPGSQSNLVVVTTTGGGILAAAWTTWALHELTTDRPQLADEIRLISGVSGGSVGAAFWVNGLLEARQSGRFATNATNITTGLFTSASASSLAAVAYGLAFQDIPRMLSVGGLPFWTRDDRGRELEAAWARQGLTQNPNRLTLRGLNQHISNGIIPSVIFGSTVVETGQRVMLTGLHFPTTLSNAPTLSSYIGADIDVDLWTAARMSASFPYVTPVARACFTNLIEKPALDARPRAEHHFADGGYYDNFGVAAALDWLEPVLLARLRGGNGLTFRRVLILQLRAYEPEGNAKAQTGGEAAFIGPAVTLMNVYSTSARSRNDLELSRYLDAWNARFEKAGSDAQGVRLETVVLERPDRFGPLSWHLRKKDIRDLKSLWTTNTVTTGKVHLMNFLRGDISQEK